MKRGVVGIKGVKTNLYLCLGADGAAYGSVRASTKHKSRVKMVLNSFVFFKHNINIHVTVRLRSETNSILFMLV